MILNGQRTGCTEQGIDQPVDEAGLGLFFLHGLGILHQNVAAAWASTAPLASDRGPRPLSPI
jgi:hypothetical protein